MQNFLIYNARLIDAFSDCTGAVFATQGKINAIYKNTNKAPSISFPKDTYTLDAKGLVLCPCFVDIHAHFRSPGQEQKENIKTGSHAALNGGYGCVVCMPNTTPVISCLMQALENEKKAKNIGLIDMFQAVSLTKDFNGLDTTGLDDLRRDVTPLVSEDGRDVENPFIMLEAMKKAAKKNIVVSCHCEDAILSKKAKDLRGQALSLLKQYGTNILQETQENTSKLNPVQKKQVLSLLKKAHTLLKIAEDTATARNIRLALEAKCSLNITHCSTAYSLSLVKLAKLMGQDITVDVTPHHISLSNADPLAEFWLVNPPIQSEADRLSLIQGIKDGTVDMIGTDHAPHTIQDKIAGSPGFSGLETAFCVCYTTLVKAGHIDLKHLSKLMSYTPAKRLGLNCGLLKEGFASKLVLLDTQKKITVEPKNFFSLGKCTPQENKTFFGAIQGCFPASPSHL